MMKIIDSSMNNSLLIAPSIIKDKLLDEINNSDELLNIKIISFNELKKELLFDYSEEAVLFLMDHYNLKKEVASLYLNNLYYVEDKKYKSDKLNKLVEIKSLLLENNLISENKLFIEHYKNKKVYVFGYDYIDSFNKSMLNYFDDVTIINKDKINNDVKIYECNNLIDEVNSLLENVVKLIDSGVSLSNIVFCNLNDDYKREIYKLFSMSNINVQIDKSSSIASTIIGKDALDKLYELNSYEDTLSYLKDNYNLENEYINNIYLKVVSIFNKYSIYDYDFNTIYGCIKDDFNKYNVTLNNTSGIRVEEFNNNYFNDDEYVFLVGFNEGVLPLIHKDEDFITDNIKDEIGIDKTNVLNNYEKIGIINNILSIKNITISYKLKDKEEDFFKSNILNDDMFTTLEYKPSEDELYSSTYAKLKLASLIDNLIKYDNKSEYLDTLYNSIKISYREYDNSYKKIDKELLKEYLNNKITLSYSHINTFFNCSFKYYIDNILKINSSDDTFDTFIGNLFHFVLSKINEDNFDLDKLWNEYLSDKELTSKEWFYLDKLKEELVIIVDFIKEMNKDTGLTNSYTERRIEIDKSHEISVLFKGFVDKIMYKEYDGNTLVSIIDYKTGNASSDIHDIIYGLSLQLVIYLYLIDKGKLFDSYVPVGFYLQKILSSEVNIEEGTTYVEQKYKNLKLNGYSTDNVLNLSRFDPTYEDSKYIMSMKTSSKGFYPYSKVLSEEEMKNIIDLVDKKIDEVVLAVENASFDINPKALDTDKSVTGCKYCSYKDICYRKNEDIVNLKKYKDLSFLS